MVRYNNHIQENGKPVLFVMGKSVRRRILEKPNTKDDCVITDHPLENDDPAI